MALTESLPNGPASKIAGGSHCSGPVRTKVESGAGAAAGAAAGVVACASCASASAAELEKSLAAYDAAVKVVRRAKATTKRAKRWMFVGVIMAGSLSSAIEYSMQGYVRVQSVSTKEAV